MFPGDQSPPGVFVSEDQSEVTSPLSIAEWLLGFHAEARQTHGCLEGICYAGEILHVPSGWWHLVVNLNPSIAVTQNFVPEVHVGKVLDFLKHKPDQVSGFRTTQEPYDLFVQRLEERYPDVLSKALKKVAETGTVKKRKWDEVRTDGEGANDRSQNFSFGFGNDDDDVP